MSLSVHWWESSPLLTSVSTIAAVLTVVAAIWAAMYASRPRRGLAYAAAWDLPTEEQMEWVESALPSGEQQRAVVVTFVLRGSGRLDVSTSAFDDATPITLRVKGAEIRSMRPVSTRRGGGLVPASKLDDNKLEIGPGLIGRNQVLTYTLIAVTENRLVSSGPAPVNLTSALIDTRLRTDKRNTLIAVGVFAAVAAGFVGLWYGWLRHVSTGKHGAQSYTIPIAILLALVAQVVYKGVTQYLDEHWVRFVRFLLRLDEQSSLLPRNMIIRLRQQSGEQTENPPEA